MIRSHQQINQDLNRINNWDFQWKMSFNSDPSKQAEEVIFSRKLQMSTHPSLSFNNNTATQSARLKHLGMFLNTKLNFQGHLKSIFKNVNKMIGLLHKLHHTLPRLPLTMEYHIQSTIRSFISPKIIIYPIQLSSSYNGPYKRDSTETL